MIVLAFDKLTNEINHIVSCMKDYIQTLTKTRYILPFALDFSLIVRLFCNRL